MTRSRRMRREMKRARGISKWRGQRRGSYVVQSVNERGHKFRVRGPFGTSREQARRVRQFQRRLQ